MLGMHFRTRGRMDIRQAQITAVYVSIWDQIITSTFVPGRGRSMFIQAEVEAFTVKVL